MDATPQVISPELVLVDPDLASVARLLLPEPSWSSGPRISGFELDPVTPAGAAGPRDRRAAERLKDLGTTLLLTVAAASLTLNGFLIAVAMKTGTSAAAAQTVQERSFVPDARLSVAHFSVAATTATTVTTAALPATTTTRKTTRRVSARPTAVVHRAVKTLRWHAVTDATYYDVVLWRGGKRLLDLWPVTPTVDLPTAQVNHGSQTRLSPGRYLWFVYPGLGAKSSRRYGSLAASGVLVVHPKGGTWPVSDSRYPSSPRSLSRASRYQ
jgi:hypothetical protein